MSKSIVIDVKGNPWLKNVSEGIVTEYVRIPINLDEIKKIIVAHDKSTELIHYDDSRIKLLGYFPDMDASQLKEISIDLISKLVEVK